MTSMHSACCPGEGVRQMQGGRDWHAKEGGTLALADVWARMSMRLVMAAFPLCFVPSAPQLGSELDRRALRKGQSAQSVPSILFKHASQSVSAGTSVCTRVEAHLATQPRLCVPPHACRLACVHAA